MSDSLLSVEGLTTSFETQAGTVTAVNGVSFQIRQGETLGLVGESGSGKSVTAFSIIRLVQPPGRVTAGRVLFQGRDLVSLPEEELRQVRGAGIGFVFQEPMAALNPVMRVGDHIAEALRVHGLATRAEARARAVDLLRAVRIVDAEHRVNDYPHQLSGGMRQRAMIAMALSCNPKLLIADEPTTALDVTIEAQILELIRSLQEEYGMALMYISHDLAVVSEMSDEIMIMYLGQVMEHAPTGEIFDNPLHPYTQALWRSIPLVEGGQDRLMPISGTLPNPYTVHKGCPFYSRCEQRLPGMCDANRPPMVDISPTHRVACFLYKS